MNAHRRRHSNSLRRFGFLSAGHLPLLRICRWKDEIPVMGKLLSNTFFQLRRNPNMG